MIKYKTIEQAKKDLGTIINIKKINRFGSLKTEYTFKNESKYLTTVVYYANSNDIIAWRK